jgi:hypothetical protein
MNEKEVIRAWQDPTYGTWRFKGLPRGTPLYGFFSLPRGRLLKVCAEPCMFAPSYLQSNKPRWPRG